MADAQAQMNQLATQLTALVNAMNTQNQNFTTRQNNQAARENRRDVEAKHSSILRCVHNAGTFEVSKNFRDFLTQHEMWRNVNSVNLVQEVENANGVREQVYLCPSDMQAKLFLSCFRGAAASRVKVVGIDTPAWNETILNGAQNNQNQRFEDFVARVKNLFMPEEESPLARSQFQERKQDAREDITNYVSDKLNLYHLAYTEQQAANNFDFLLDQVVSGIYNQEVRRRLIESNPRDETTLRTTATRLVAEERKKVEMDCSGSTSMDGLMATSRNAYSEGGNNSFMQVDALHQVQQVRGAQPTDLCRNCGKAGHWARECRSPPKRGGGGGGGRPAPRRQGGQNNKTQTGAVKTKGKCHHCGKVGHFKRDCRSYKASMDKKKNNGGRGGGGRNRRQMLKQIPEEESEDDAEVVEDYEEGED